MNEAAVLCSVVKNPIQVTNRLAELGWAVDELLEVVSAMVGARGSCTENHPASAAGWMSWAEGIRRLREIALPKGLVRADTDGIPWTANKKRGVRFAVQNTTMAQALKAAHHRIAVRKERQPIAQLMGIKPVSSTIFQKVR